MSTKNSEIKPIEYSCNGKIVTFNTPLLMAIVNVTPDSFYDGGKFDTPSDVLHDVEEKIKQGAHIIDLGAASTRPNAPVISETEEWARLKDVLPQIRKNFPNTLLSIDTYRASIAEKAADAGIDIINDIGGGTLDAAMYSTVAKLQLPYILMHIQGTPQTMQNNPIYLHVVSEVKNDLQGKIHALASLNFHKIILDPGFGFGKSLENNYDLLKHLDAFQQSGYPLLVGVSRKGMINKVIGTNAVTALNGTTVLNTIALLNGAHILRVHDVKEAKQAIDLVQFYKRI
jgi:dihydropteroate synthase